MNKSLLTLSLFVAVFFTSCDKANEIIDELLSSDIVSGLKTALEVGTENTVANVSQEGGYFNNPAIKILLPEEAQASVNAINNAISKINLIPGASSITNGFSNKVDNAIRSLNDAAESAAKDAGPIFKNSITNLSISDGLTILNGRNPASSLKSGSESGLTAGFDSTAATAYLKSTTYNELVAAYKTPVNKALDAAGTTEIWETFAETVNKIAPYANMVPGVNVQTINTDLGEYVTGKALDGLFNRVGGVEKDIRKDPAGWAQKTGKAILSRVFGSNKK